jgi:hypothetical protein
LNGTTVVQKGKNSSSAYTSNKHTNQTKKGKNCSNIKKKAYKSAHCCSYESTVQLLKKVSLARIVHN